MVLDFGTLTYGLAVSGRFAAFLVFIFAWVIVGNGSRFGVRYMWCAAALALCGYGWVVATNAYWTQVPELAFAFGGFLVIVPAYLSVLLGRLTRANAALKEQSDQLARTATRARYADQLHG